MFNASLTSVNTTYQLPSLCQHIQECQSRNHIPELAMLWKVSLKILSIEFFCHALCCVIIQVVGDSHQKIPIENGLPRDLFDSTSGEEENLMIVSYFTPLVLSSMEKYSTNQNSDFYNVSTIYFIRLPDYLAVIK